jgi:hypothetical protein
MSESWRNRPIVHIWALPAPTDELLRYARDFPDASRLRRDISCDSAAAWVSTPPRHDGYTETNPDAARGPD